MSRSIFGCSYPPGCSGPPEGPDPSPISEEICGLLEENGNPQGVIDKVTSVIDDLVLRADNCPQCEKRRVEAEDKFNREIEEAHTMEPRTGPDEAISLSVYSDAEVAALKEERDDLKAHLSIQAHNWSKQLTEERERIAAKDAEIESLRGQVATHYGRGIAYAQAAEGYKQTVNDLEYQLGSLHADYDKLHHVADGREKEIERLKKVCSDIAAANRFLLCQADAVEQGKNNTIGTLRDWISDAQAKRQECIEDAQLVSSAKERSALYLLQWKAEQDVAAYERMLPLVEGK